jgi:hypothetical protein
MSHENTPRACFKAAVQADGRPGDPLPMIDQRLRDQFDFVRVKQPLWLTPRFFVLGSGAQSVSAVVGQSKYAPGEWVLVVGPGGKRGLLDRLLSTDLSVSASELKHTCSRIHRALTAIPQLSAIRWYFEGTRTQSAAVHTPDELPWDRDELRQP